MKLYASQRDPVFLLVIWSVALFAVAMMAPAIKLASWAELVFLSVIVGAFDAVLLRVLYGTAYWFESDALRIRSGPLRMRIPLAEISLVRPSRDARLSPACSLDRLALQYGKRWILISPRERQAFVDELQRLVPDLKRIDC